MSDNLSVQVAQHSGWVLLDKPEGISSAKALAVVKRSLGVKKAGHAGTLDPAASGLLLIALGEACKLLSLLDFQQKSYDFETHWGFETDTDDGQGTPTLSHDHLPSFEAIKTACYGFIGNYDQLPPQYSALKIQGKRAYQLAREGKEANLKSRQVSVHDFQASDHHKTHGGATGVLGVTQCQTILGKGGYVRSLGRDLAHALGARAHVRHIRRKKIGQLSVENAIPLAFFEKKAHKVDAERWGKVLPLTSVLDDIPVLDVSSTQTALLRLGQCIPIDEFALKDLPHDITTAFLLKDSVNVIGIGKFKGDHVAPKRMIKP